MTFRDSRASGPVESVREVLGRLSGVTVLRVPRSERRLPRVPSGSDVLVLAIARRPPKAAAPAARDRRAAQVRLGAARVRFAGFELDLVERKLTVPGGGTSRLPGLEFALLKLFLGRPRCPLARDELARMLTRRSEEVLSGRSVDSYVSRLRRRLRQSGASGLIRTLPGTGYAFDADAQPIRAGGATRFTG